MIVAVQLDPVPDKTIKRRVQEHDREPTSDDEPATTADLRYRARLNM